MKKNDPSLSIKASEAAIPADLRKALAAVPSVQALWKSLTPIGRRDFIGWVTSAKKPETRAHRVEVTISKLKSGKRRPCCYSVVPMNLYRALGEIPKAKAAWSALSPDERRDWAGWIEEAKDSETRAVRVEKACSMLARGNKHPR